MTVENKNLLEQIDVSKILLDNSRGDSTGLRQLCALFDPNNIAEENLLNFLSQLRENVGLLNEQTRFLIYKVLNINWDTVSDSILKEHSQFLVSLAVGQVFYLEHVLRCVVKKFLPNVLPTDAADGLETLDQKFSASFNRIYGEAHFVIQCILRVSPMCHGKLLKILTECFPFMKRHALQIRDYIRNLLWLSNSDSVIRVDIFGLIIDELLRIDTICKKESLIKTLETKQNEGTEIFPMECDVDQLAKESSSTSKLADLTSKLDASVYDLLTHINTRCRDTKGRLSEDVVDVYHEFFGIFDRIVLPVFSCTHVQYVWFYLCSLREDLCAHFLNWLWQKVQDPSAEPVIRQSASCYLSGFLTRAEYVSLSQCKTYLKLFVDWLHQYELNEDSASKREGVVLHGTFYAVFQAVLYVVTFRHKQLLELRKGLDFLRNLNLDRLITCSLNPLKFCFDAVVTNFASVSRNYQFAFCYTVIERNRRTALYDRFQETSKHDLKLATTKRLDCFFPFDPYFLSQYSSFIVPIYRHYDEVEYATSSDAKLERSSTNNEDDYLLNEEMMSCSLEKDKNVVRNLTQSYGLSPGYKKHG